MARTLNSAQWNSLALRLKFWAWRAGVPAALTVGIFVSIAVALSLYITRLDSVVERELEAAHRAALQARRSATPSTPVLAKSEPESGLTFGRSSLVTDYLAQLQEIAAVSELAVNVLEYRADRTRSGLTTLEITMPVKCTYPQLRGFLSKALSSMPHLALMSLDIRRDRVASNTVETTLVMRLFLQADTSVPLIMQQGEQGERP